MTNADALLTAIRAGQLDDATISAALDALREECDCYLCDALMKVAQAVRDWQWEQDREQAQRYLEDEDGWRETLLEAIREEVDWAEGTEPVIEVLTGDGEPDADGWMLPLPTNRPPTQMIVVGAGWILNVVAQERYNAHYEFDAEGHLGESYP